MARKNGVRLGVENLERRDNPAPYATGAAAGGAPHVQVFDGSGAVIRSFYAYDASFTGGVRVAMADLNGGGTPDLITAPGPGGGPEIRIFSGESGYTQQIADYFAFDSSDRGGVYVAAGDVNGDGFGDVVVSGFDRASMSAKVRVFSAFLSQMLPSGIQDYNPWGTGNNYVPGFPVAVGDTDGNDGHSEIIVGNPGGNYNVHTDYFGYVATTGQYDRVRVEDPPDAKVYDYFTASVEQNLDFGLFSSSQPVFVTPPPLNFIYNYQTQYNQPVMVGAGDIDGDGKADVVAGASSTTSLASKLFYKRTTTNAISSFNPFGSSNGTVSVAVRNIDGLGTAEVLVGSGAGIASAVNVYNYSWGNLGLLRTQSPYGGFNGGVWVG
ncbi:FG-GAP repeat protein [Gemmata massiliana]|uniref:FG-GAP repeat protein n=1 Tax=Gemmata massiliana TaxID=1210884 RepID=UPI0013A6E434|nr:FG-GAP repeat protein [Gemmata massiliana]